CARHAINERNADEKEKRGSEIDDNVVQVGAHTKLAGAMQHKAIRGCKHHLEEDEEIEKVACQECAVEAHQQEQEKRMEMWPRPVPTRQRKNQRWHGKRRRQCQHEAG